MQPRLIEKVWKGKLGKITFACTAVHQCQSEADISLWHSLLPVSPCAHCFSEGRCCLYSERPTDDFWQPERLCLSQGVVRQHDWASSCPCRPVQHLPLHPRSSLIAFFLIGCLTNQQIDHVCCANRWRAEVIQRAEKKPATGSWLGRRREHDSPL